MPEEEYINPAYCLECLTKHGNRVEHHLEDLVTASKDDPELRRQAQEMLDKAREIRKQVDDLRIKELAKLRQTV
jgi:erythromycin esterase-like protein